MEVYNWGTFDEDIHSIKPLGETSLLTGANGSGKTTFVDALLTLIVPEKKYRFYNQSSGAEKKGDRTEETYVLGGYGTINSESSGTIKPLFLRENKEETYSILLAHFANEAGQYVTLFQVRYFVNGEMKRHFAIAHRPLHITDDFRPFDFAGNWKRRIDQQYNRGSRKQVEWFDSTNKYALRITEVLGMQSTQALSLFNQTVGIKVLGNLDEFIRLHMLEPRNMEDQFIELKRHLGTLLDAQLNIEKAEEQIRLLKPLQQHYETYTLYKKQLDFLQQEAETVVIWNSFAEDQLLTAVIQEDGVTLNDIRSHLASVSQAIEDLREKERNTRNLLEQNKAGQKLKQYEEELKELNSSLQQTGKNYTLFTDWCTQLHLKETTATDEITYKRILTDSRRAGFRIEREQRLNEDDDFEAKNTLKKATVEKEEIEKELNVLLQSKNNIPAYLFNLRKELCNELKIDTTELPFAGELIQVKQEEIRWEAAMEKLLRGFALRLLVPEKYYKRVNKYVNNTNLRSRLVYYRVHDAALSQYPAEETVYEKLEFHPENKLTGWLQQQVIRQFDYSCIEDEKTMERYTKAITLNGLIKNNDRHEKDDRPERNNPGDYVLGWNNEKKKQSFIKRRDTLAGDILTSEETVERCKRKAERLNKQVYALKRIGEQEGFSFIDVNGFQRKIHQVLEQMKTLKESSEQLKVLTAQLQDIQQQVIGADEKRTALIREESLSADLLVRRKQQKEQLQPLLLHLDEPHKDLLLQFQQRHADRLTDLSLDSIKEIYQSLKTHINDGIDGLKENLYKEEKELNKGISRIKNPSIQLQQRFPGWSGDVMQLPEDPVYTNEYIEWMEKLEKDNLPKYKKDFEDFINVTITYKIGGLNEALEKWAREIKNNITRLNQSLAEIHFNRLPDTYIQLGIRNVTLTELTAFRHQLLEALPQAANWQQSSFEEKAWHFRERVQPLINSLDENESYRARVLDVRNWFEFWADEKYQQTQELKKTYRQMGQLSGGEKAQLTYTILCSAIAYQFGITREGKNSKSLRFIAVDESFSNQDEEKSTYLMELCRQLHLQLLVVTPSDKIQIVQDFIAHVHLVQRINNRQSVLYNMTIKELKEKMQESVALAETGREE
jgi:uncharacterized protein YPO0396